MFTKRRQSSLFANSKYRNYNRSRGSIPQPWLIAAIPLAFLAIEILLRVGVGIAGKGAELDAYEGEPANVTDYRFKPLNAAKQSLQGEPSYGRLAVQSHPLTGYQLTADQKNAAVVINAQGVRSETPIELVKPKNEVRVLLIGGSTAFGKFSRSNQVTFAQRLENRLNQQVQAQKTGQGKYRPDVMPYYADELEKALKLPPKIREANYRVINAAVPGYTSANTLADLSSRLLPYQPDAIVLIDGYADLLTPASQVAASLGTDERLATNAIGHLASTVGEGVKGLCNWFYISKAWRYWVLKPEPTLAQRVDPLADGPTNLADRLASDDPELGARTDRYHRNLQQIARLSHGANIPLIVAIQPELSQRQAAKQTPAEKQRLEALGANYSQRVQSGYQRLQKALDAIKTDPKAAGMSTLTLKTGSEQFADGAFQDTIHLTDAAQEGVANQLYDAIAPKLQVQPKPASESPTL